MPYMAFKIDSQEMTDLTEVDARNAVTHSFLNLDWLSF